MPSGEPYSSRVVQLGSGLQLHLTPGLVWLSWRPAYHEATVPSRRGPGPIGSCAIRNCRTGPAQGPQVWFSSPAVPPNRAVVVERVAILVVLPSQHDCPTASAVDRVRGFNPDNCELAFGHGFT